MAMNHRGSAPPCPAGAGGDGAQAGALAAWQALREHSAAPADAVRWQFMESLARRAEGQPEPVRRLLHDRLRRAVDDYLARYPVPAAASGTETRRGQVGQRGPLADLLQALTHTPSTDPDTPTLLPRVATVGRPPDLKALEFFRLTWARLSVHRSLNQSLAKTPKNAGPLNSHRLVLRSLELMREVSPAYLNCFIAHVDALLMLDGMGSPATTPTTSQAAPTSPAPAGERKRKASKGVRVGRG